MQQTTESGDNLLTFQPVADTAQVVMMYTQNGEPCQNIYYVQKFTPGTFSSADLTALGTVFANWEHTSALPVRNQSVVYNGAKCIDVSTESGPEVIVTTHSGEGGSQTGVQLPNSVTIALKWGTGSRGRSFRGRTYWIGLEQDQISANHVTSATRTAILNAYNTLLSNLSSASPSMEMGIVSRYHNKIKRVSGLFTPVLAPTFVDDIVDVQRRRLPAHNRHR